MDKSVQNIIVPTGNTPVSRENHRPTGLWYMVKYRTPKFSYWQQMCNVIIVSMNCE